MKYKRHFIDWPNPLERAEIVEKTRHELPFCVGYVDGSEVKLAEKPQQDPESYFSRKHIYSIKVQEVCDWEQRLRHLVVGYQGSVHDARIYNNCDLSKEPRNFFSDNEWLAGDSAYKLATTVITPFRANNCASNKQKFNKRFSRYRIRIEHCFGLLKETFGSLKELRPQIRNDDCVKNVCEWIVVCAILHNIAIAQKDELDWDLLNSKNVVGEPVLLKIPATREGEQKRRYIMNLLGLKTNILKSFFCILFYTSQT